MADWTRVFDFFFFFWAFSTFEKLIAILGLVAALGATWAAIYPILKEWRQKRILSKEC